MTEKKRGIPERCQHGSHGLRAMEGSLKRIRDNDGDWVAELGAVGQVVRELKADLIVDLGGEERVSTAQRIVIEQTAKTWTMLQSIDAWLLRQKSLVNRRNRVLFAVVLQRQTLEDSLIRNLKALGLKKKAKPTPSLHEYLATRVSDAKEGAEPQRAELEGEKEPQAVREENREPR